MNLSVIICAKDAAATIERAVRSVLPERHCALLLVDDHSSDKTVARAQHVAGERLQVVRARAPGGIPLARQTGLDACGTEFAAWLDADDEWIPGRATRIVRALQAGVDVYSDPIELTDGATGARFRRLDVPDFVRREAVPARLFERNHLPGDTQVGFRVAAFRDAGGCDAAAFGAESFDILLRVIARG
ncbi:MAG: glycosyltransferase family 2 protein, partial [Opitutaceae bacterium]